MFTGPGFQLLLLMSWAFEHACLCPYPRGHLFSPGLSSSSFHAPCACLVTQSWPTLRDPARLLRPWVFSGQEFWSGLPCHPPYAAPVQFISVAQSRPTLCHPVNGSTPGLSVHQQISQVQMSVFILVSCGSSSSEPLAL